MSNGLSKNFGIAEEMGLGSDDSEILHNVLELSNKKVKESMVPRIEIEAVEKKTSIVEVSHYLLVRVTQSYPYIMNPLMT